MDGGPEEIPEEATEGAAQELTPEEDGGHSHYILFLVSGDFEEAPQEESDFRAMLKACSNMTATYDDVELDGSMYTSDSATLPEHGDEFTMEVSGAGFEMVTRIAWAEMDGVHFALVSMHTGPEEIDPRELGRGSAQECEVSDAQCLERIRERSEKQAQAVIDEEFDQVLDAAVRALS